MLLSDLDMFRRRLPQKVWLVLCDVFILAGISNHYLSVCLLLKKIAIIPCNLNKQ